MRLGKDRHGKATGSRWDMLTTRVRGEYGLTGYSPDALDDKTADQKLTSSTKLLGNKSVFTVLCTYKGLL